MPSSEQIRQAIVNTLQAVSHIGKVNAYERFAVREKDIINKYAVPVSEQPPESKEATHTINGWYVHRRSFRREEISSASSRIYINWQVGGFMSLLDEAASQLLFDQLIDDVVHAFYLNHRLGGLVRRIGEGTTQGPQLETNDIVMFAGILCHRCSLALATVHDAAYADEETLALGNPHPLEQMWAKWRANGVLNVEQLIIVNKED